MKQGMLALALIGLAACRQAPPSSSDNATIEPDPRTDAPDVSAGAPPLTPEPDHARADPGRISRYTSLAKDNCKLVEQSDEGPYWRMQCGGVDGFAVDYTESDLRQGIEVIAPGGRKTSLDLASKVAKGAFEHLGPKIEWRGDAGKAPDAIMVRMSIARPEGGPDRSVLAVAALRPTPCVIGVVEASADMNARAQALADKGGACL